MKYIKEDGKLETLDIKVFDDGTTPYFNIPNIASRINVNQETILKALSTVRSIETKRFGSV